MTVVSHAEMTGTEVLSGFAERLQPSAIPRDVTESAKLRILDVLGICIAATEETGPSLVQRMAIDWGGRRGAHCIGSDLRLPAAMAALVNGTRAHSLDFDDTHHRSRTHPSCVIVPTALAVGESKGASGQEILTATVVGLEVLVRVGLVAPGRFHERGLHATSLCGVIGAAAAASRILAMGSPQITNALGISASTACGLREAYLGGQATDTKAFHAGWAAHAGIASAELSAAGFSGPKAALEGRFGFYNAFVSPEEWDLSRLVDGLGEEWYTPEIVFKLFPCGSLIHASIEAALSLRREHEIDPDDIEEVVVVVPPGMVSTVCEPVEQKLQPTTGYQARFSAQYAVAAALQFGSVTDASFRENVVNDPTLRSLLSRVRYRTDPAMPFPDKYPGRVVVRSRRGESYDRAVPNSPGSLDRPAGEGHIREKFRSNVEGRVAAGAAEELADRVMEFDKETSVDDLLELCRVRASGS